MEEGTGKKNCICQPPGRATTSVHMTGYTLRTDSPSVVEVSARTRTAEHPVAFLETAPSANLTCHAHHTVPTHGTAPDNAGGPLRTPRITRTNHGQRSRVAGSASAPRRTAHTPLSSIHAHPLSHRSKPHPPSPRLPSPDATTHLPPTLSAPQSRGPPGGGGGSTPHHSGLQWRPWDLLESGFGALLADEILIDLAGGNFWEILGPPLGAWVVTGGIGSGKSSAILLVITEETE
jgi:hypothetical protein